MREDGFVARKKKRPIDEPAGVKRTEAMAQAKDDLAEKAEALPKESISPRKIEINREIASVLVQQQNKVSGGLPDKVYCWVRYRRPDGTSDSSAIDAKLVEEVTVDGQKQPMWEVVTGDMPEARERKGVGADSTRRIGDVLLMRCDRDVYAAWQDNQERYTQLFNGRAIAPEGGRVFIDKGRRVHVSTISNDPNDKRYKKMMTSAAANEIANRQFDQQIREGRVAGVAVGQ